MKCCTRCGTHLACGWWCNECRMTLNTASYIKFLEERYSGGKDPIYVWVLITMIAVTAACFAVAGLNDDNTVRDRPSAEQSGAEQNAQNYGGEGSR